jgi:hypothetical protein
MSTNRYFRWSTIDGWIGHFSDVINWLLREKTNGQWANIRIDQNGDEEFHLPMGITND